MQADRGSKLLKDEAVGVDKDVPELSKGFDQFNATLGFFEIDLETLVGPQLSLKPGASVLASCVK